MKFTIFCLFIAAICAGAPAASGQSFLFPRRTTVAPKLDGSLDDSVWRNAPHVTGFETFAPDYGAKIVEQTDVMMEYDDENLYFGVRCYDPEPGKIKTSISSRDNMLSDDWFCLNLDSFYDQQGLYAFYVNPAGIQADSRSAAGREDFSLDYVWFSAGKMDSAGYTLEIQVPLKSIRYADSDTSMMSVIFERYISRRSEHSSYPALDPAKGLTSFVTQVTQNVHASVSYRNTRAIYYDVLVQGRTHRVSADLLYQPSEKLQAEGGFVYTEFFRESDDVKMYDYLISRLKLTFQLNRYLFFRGIAQYNNYKKELTTDLLASFTYIPGTVLFLGYGSLYNKLDWGGTGYTQSDRFLEMQRGFFFKTSYLWRA